MRRTNTKIIDLGDFVVESGKLIVSDPCYEPGTWCQGKIPNVQNGNWTAKIRFGPTFWHDRVWELFVHHCDTLNPKFIELQDFEVGVDSGQAGIFDAEEFYGGNADLGDGGWYDACSHLTLDTKHGAGVLPGGCVSSSGFGDGGYECWVSLNENEEVNGVKIIFISDEE